MDDLFDDVGSKLKITGKIVFVLMVIGTAIGGFAALFEFSLAGIITFVVGFAGAYVAAICFIGLGECVDASYSAMYEVRKLQSEIYKANQLNNQSAQPQKEKKESVNASQEIQVPAAEETAVSDSVAKFLICPRCGKTQFANKKNCFNCGAELK